MVVKASSSSVRTWSYRQWRESHGLQKFGQSIGTESRNLRHILTKLPERSWYLIHFSPFLPTHFFAGLTFTARQRSVVTDVAFRVVIRGDRPPPKHLVILSHLVRHVSDPAAGDLREPTQSTPPLDLEHAGSAADPRGGDDRERFPAADAPRHRHRHRRRHHHARPRPLRRCPPERAC